MKHLPPIEKVVLVECPK